MERLFFGVIVTIAVMVSFACSSGQKAQIFDFASPAAGSTCAEAAEHLRQRIPSGIKQVGKIYFHASPSPIIDRPESPSDFVVVIDHPASRDEFLDLRQDVSDGLDDWLESAGLKADDFKIVWVPNPEPYERLTGRDPSGRAVFETLQPADQTSGSLCADA